MAKSMLMMGWGDEKIGHCLALDCGKPLGKNQIQTILEEENQTTNEPRGGTHQGICLAYGRLWRTRFHPWRYTALLTPGDSPGDTSHLGGGCLTLRKAMGPLESFIIWLFKSNKTGISECLTSARFHLEWPTPMAGRWALDKKNQSASQLQRKQSYKS